MAAIALVIAGWSGAWMYGRSVLNGQIEAGVSDISRVGLDVDCRDLQIGGYPFRYEVRCASLSVQGASRNQVLVNGVQAVALVYNPWHVILEGADGRFVETSAAGRAEVAWQSLRSSVTYSSEDLGNLDIVVDQPEIRAESVAGLVRGIAEKAELHLRETPNRAGGLEVFLSLDGIEPEIRLAGFTAPPAAEPMEAFHARVHIRLQDGKSLFNGAALPVLVQMNGGELPVGLVFSELTLGEGRLRANGDFLLAGDGTLSGNGAFFLKDAGEALKAIKPFIPDTNNTYTTVETLLTSLKPNAEDEAGDPVVELPFTIDQGVVRIGFVQLGRIPPLFLAGL
ncbi:DUF2125 domain-containing protein [Roseibium denhamense]